MDQTSADQSKLTIIKHMIKQIRNGTPVHKVQLPLFMQEPRSLLERYADFNTHLDILLRIPSLKTPEERFVEVIRFYVSGWYIRTKEIRNPFNPVLGEVFKCKYEQDNSTTEYVAEQISHHPPSSAFCVMNENKGMYLSAFIRPVFKFKGNSLDGAMQGKIVGHDSVHQEDYDIVFPHIIVNGLVLGSLSITFGGEGKVTCPQSGYYAELDFQSKGFFHGKSNYLTGCIKHTSNKKPIYTIEGKWDDVLYITHCKSGVKQVFFDCNNCPKASTPIVAPVEQQDANESRRVWNGVTKNMGVNEQEAIREKRIVEENQRALERDRADTWTPKVFSKASEDFYLHKRMVDLLHKKSSRELNRTASADRLSASVDKLSLSQSGNGLPVCRVQAN